MTIRVLIADDHLVVRQGLRMFLELEPDLAVVAEAENGKQAIEMTRQHSPDVVLMDLLMPEVSGVEAIEVIRKEMPDVEVIALTSVLEDKAIFDAIRVGAISYLLKNTEAEKLCEAIKAASVGQVRLSPEVAARLMQDVRGTERAENLTEQERKVLCLLARGLSNKEIGGELFISETTVKTHVSSILNKLHMPSRTRAALYALKIGLVSLDDADLKV